MLILISSLSLSAEAVRYKPVEFNEELVESMKEYDRQMYDPLPNRIDCEMQSYLENCDHINLMLKKHPDAPMRIPTKEGTEVVLQPDTPTAFVDFILSPNQESAKKTLTFWRNQINRLESVSDSMYSEIFEQGGVIPGQTSIEHRSQPRLSEFINETEDLKLVMIVESSCPACKYQLGIVKNMADRFPNLNIVIYQLDQNFERFQQNVIDQGLTGEVLHPAKAEQVLKSIQGWPFTRITNTTTDYKLEFYGSKPTQSLVQEIAYAAKFIPETDRDDQ